MSRAMTHKLSALMVVLAVAVGAGATAFAQGDMRQQLRACVAERRAAFSAVQPFESPELTLTCPGADLVGFPPRAQRHERNELVTYAAREGYRIVPGSVRLCSIPQEAAAAQPVTVSADGLTAQTPLSCSGGGIGAAPITVSARICGEERPADTAELEKSWLVECARAIRRDR